jgi:MFS transporter, PAT family, beta-lactamase induction signal transducer AmpG
LKRSFVTREQDMIYTTVTRGQIGLTGVSLSSAPLPGEEVVLNTVFQRGDGSIRLVAGERLVFNSSNWNQTGWIAVQLDPALDREAEAFFEGLSGNIPLAWSFTFFFLTGLFLLFMIYHRFFLPYPASDTSAVSSDNQNIIKEFAGTFTSFFKKANIGPAIAFLLLYRLGEAQLVKMASPFMLDPVEAGGLGLTTGEVGLIYGTIGIIALTLGGILGGVMASRKGLKYWIFPMALAINIPNIVYVLLSRFSPDAFWIISGGVALEQFGYGFGFTAYMLFMIHFSEGSHKTAHFAFCTGFMALGMMLPGMISGWIQEIVGYYNFFIWVLICTIPGFITIMYLKIDPGFGVKKKG